MEKSCFVFPLLPFLLISFCYNTGEGEQNRIESLIENQLGFLWALSLPFWV